MVVLPNIWIIQQNEHTPEADTKHNVSPVNHEDGKRYCKVTFYFSKQVVVWIYYCLNFFQIQEFLSSEIEKFENCTSNIVSRMSNVLPDS